MSCRVDSTLIAGACVVGDRGLGVLGSVIRADTATGTHGPGYLYNDWQAGDDAKEFRGLIVTPPASGTLFAYEDGSFDFTAPADGSYSFVYRLFVDGADLGTATASFTVGAGSGVTAAVAGTGAITYTGTGAVVATIGAASDLTAAVAGVGAVAYTGTGAVVASIADPAPSTEPVTVAEVKRAARISDTSAFDDLIPGLISAARQLAEQETGRELVRKTRRYTFSDWPAADHPLYMYQADVAAVSYWGESGWTALDGAAFAFYELGTATGIAPAVGTSWPALAAVAGGPRVRVDLTAGPADPTTADACVKQYITALVVFWIDNPAAAQATMQPSPFLANLLDPARLWG